MITLQQKEQARVRAFDEVFDLADKQFKAFLIKEGYDSDTISEKEVNKLLTDK